MCGIAGYSLHSGSRSTGRWLPRRCSRRSPNGAPMRSGTHTARPTTPTRRSSKQRTPASQLLERISVPAEATQLLVHVRDYTKGHPSIDANNHPVRHGPVVGIHNGIITNDDELLAPHSCARAEPQMTVDSEAIFAARGALAERPRRRSSTCAARWRPRWLDEREPGVVFLARGSGRPLWLGEGRGGVFFASTRLALETVEQYCRPEAAQARGARRLVVRDRRRRGRPARALPARPRLRRARSASRRARTQRARLLPDAPRGDRSDLSSADEPSAATSTPSSSSRSRTRYWNVAHAPRRASNSR